MSHELAATAALLSDPGRASILMALVDGRALPAGELALIANVAPQTASSHLCKLVDGKLLTVEQQGRHRYYRLADAEVAHAIEALLAIAPPANRSAAHKRSARVPVGTLAYARTCYSHLAGRFAVAIADALQQRGLLQPNGSKTFRVTPRGRDWFHDVGITLTDSQLGHPRFARACLDWTERRHHIAGHLGSAMLARFRDLKWIAPVRDSRAVRITHEGERRFGELLGVRGALNGLH